MTEETRIERALTAVRECGENHKHPKKPSRAMICERCGKDLSGRHPSIKRCKQCNVLHHREDVARYYRRKKAYGVLA